MRILLLEPKYLGGLANIGGGGAVPPGPNVEPPLRVMTDRRTER